MATVAGACILVALLSAPARADHTCFQSSGIHLSNSDDTWYGGSGDDRVSALAGNDLLVSYGGTDRLCLDTGNDQAHAGDGQDSINAGWGFDWVFGGAGKDLIRAGEDNDRVYGEGGDDSPGFGVPGYNLYGDKGADYIEGNAGWDAIDGGPGVNDTCYGETRVNCEHGGPE